jgi:predicted transglutaminase-like cysteine proteinase
MKIASGRAGSYRKGSVAGLWLLAMCEFAAATAEAPRMAAGEFALAPIQFVVFCLRKPERCAPSNDVRLITLDQAWQGQIESINLEVNRSIVPLAHPPEVPWQDDATAGDCNEYALKKRSLLLDLGFPSSALLLAVAVLPSREAHLVLVVVTDQGDFVLDNLRVRMVRWDRLPYRWIKRSSPRDPQRWEFIVPSSGGPPLAEIDEDTSIIGAIKGGRGLDHD